MTETKNRLTDTLREEITRYHIGAKLRRLRLQKAMGLVQLSEHTGLSPAMLSKLERDKLVPTLPTLMRIAMVFSVGLEFFFNDEENGPPCAVVRKEDRVRLADDPSGERVAYRFESLDFPVTDRRMSAYYAEFEPCEDEAPLKHSHPGAELVYVIRGCLVLTFEHGEEELRAGDSAYFESDVEHGYRRHGSGVCSAIVVTSSAG